MRKTHERLAGTGRVDSNDLFALPIVLMLFNDSNLRLERK
jgi:hypothetical protein